VTTTFQGHGPPFIKICSDFLSIRADRSKKPLRRFDSVVTTPSRVLWPMFKISVAWRSTDAINSSV